MATTPEGKVKLRVKKLLADEKVWYFCPMGQAFGRAGIPDFICCIEGQLLAIETKAGTNKPTKLQQYEMNCIEQSGGRVIIVNESAIDALREIIHRLKGTPDEQ